MKKIILILALVLSVYADDCNKYIIEAQSHFDAITKPFKKGTDDDYAIRANRAIIAHSLKDMYEYCKKDSLIKCQEKYNRNRLKMEEKRLIESIRNNKE